MMPTSATPGSFRGLSQSGQCSPRDGTVGQAEVYKYEPIREADEIRLLNLRPEKPGDIIKADLETVCIRQYHHTNANILSQTVVLEDENGDATNYDAISYTWADENGNTTKCCSLEIGPHGLLLPITRNCDSVLRRVYKYTNRVWIDAVCINQEDVQERGKQVDLMPKIYLGASRTFAYLGENSNDSDPVLKNLAGGIWTPPYLLEPFFRRPYFSRVWVVQEIALSKHIIIMCGDTAVKWTNAMEAYHLRRIYTASYYETFPTLFQIGGREVRIESTSVLDALLLGRSCNASDPRDKVFGLMGLVLESRLPANYSMSTAEVYTRVAMYLHKVQLWGMHVILGNLCYRSDEARAQTPNLPTWVPDWNQCGPTLLQRVPRALEFLEAQNPIFKDDDDTGLFLRGKIVGTLKALRENNAIVKMDIHLSNSRVQASEKLPTAYRDKSVHVFSTMPTGYHSIYAFLVTHVDCGVAAETYSSAQWEGESQGKLVAIGGIKDGPGLLATSAATPWDPETGLLEGSDGVNNFELLGLVEIELRQPLGENVSLSSLQLAAIIQLRGGENLYSCGTRTIRIV